MFQVYLKECVVYNPKTGIFFWRNRPKHHFKTKRDCNAWNTRYSNTPVGSFDKDGYLEFSINNKKYKTHRLAFLYMTGKIPKEVDHENRIKDDNRWCNLRSATTSENGMNKDIQKNNTSGFRGVSLCSRTMKWRARLVINGNEKSLGRFQNKEDAIKTRKEAEEKYFGKFNKK